MAKRTSCADPAQHHRHLCVLKQRLGDSELAVLIRRPRYRCAICGGRARAAANLCRPEQLRHG